MVEPALADMLHIIEPVPIEEGRPTPAVLPMMPGVEPAEAEPVSPPADWIRTGWGGRIHSFTNNDSRQKI